MLLDNKQVTILALSFLIKIKDKHIYLLSIDCYPITKSMELVKIIVLFFALNICSVYSWLEPISLGTIGAGVLMGGYYYFYPSKCNSNKYIKNDYAELAHQMNQNLQGQHIATQIVLNAVKRHWNNENPSKPLVMVFNGPVGTGKNFVAKMIANAMFSDGETSEFYHFYNGRITFPSSGYTNALKVKLLEDMKNKFNKCDRSLFVFDEIDDMAEGVLNALVPILDYNTHSFLGKNIKKNKAIFLFLSNVGSDVLVDRMLKLWQMGKKRHKVTIKDLEKEMTIAIFNQKGGLRGSHAISSSLIDHYVPFLPLEAENVKECIRSAYNNMLHIKPSENEVDYILSMLSFGPEGYNLYSESGCKRIESLVSVY